MENLAYTNLMFHHVYLDFTEFILTLSTGIRNLFCQGIARTSSQMLKNRRHFIASDISIVLL
jgi:hypothetical protein